MNFLSTRQTILFTLAAILSGFEVIMITTSAHANPYGDTARELEREADTLIEYGKRQNQKIISRLSCDQLLERAEAKRRDFTRWQQIAENSTTEYNRRVSLASARGSLNATRQYTNEYKRRGC
ncbi:hypothetical protein PN478_03240 [Dolichospermum circinale CS-534/05]|uniref:hypothetical protein n=1 Tax=Dolichospermum circinale TaxID=109265 RepID=UPI0004886CD4|nr:hypothetical protein [Dolichospermum circinale]MDB9489540.1 hypothetical protein [Dolichospermum circinale CS-534/05]